MIGDHDIDLHPYRRFLFLAALAILPVLFVAALWFGRQAFFLLFAGILFAAVLDAAMRGLERLGTSRGVALALTLAAFFAALAAFFWVGGQTFIAQGGELYRALDQQADRVASLIATVRGDAAGAIPEDPKPLGMLRQLAGIWGSGGAADAVGFATGTAAVLANMAIIFFLGVFFAAAPGVYANGTARLFPPPIRPAVALALHLAGQTLRRWLLGKLFSMTLIAVLTFGGLLLVGFPLALPLAVLAGLLAFVPNLGPLLFYVPLALAGLTAGTTTLFLGLGAYAAAQMLESYVITPLIQRRMVSLPPALILFAQVLAGVLFGPWGVALATPLTAVFRIWSEKFYIARGLEGQSPERDTDET